MISNCPHCQGALKFNAAQLAKIEQALKKLKSGQRLPLKCPHCKKPMQLDAAGEAPGAAAPKTAGKAAEEPKAPQAKEESAAAIKPPPPPNTNWLDEEKQAGLLEEHARDVPTSLVLHADDGMRHQLGSAMEALGYQVVTVTTAQEAIEQVSSASFASVVFHTGFEGGTLEDSTFHAYMRKMPMSRRRYIFYILVGPQFTTLYDIEALANSANLVVGDKDIKNFQIVLHKSIPYYEQLFGPLLEELSSYGRGR
jgi:CheY-like chemotaxis protein